MLLMFLTEVEKTMFVRTLKIKKYTYVRIVKSVRINGKPHHKTIADLGNLQLKKNELIKVIDGLRKLVADVETYAKLAEIEPQGAPELGRILAAAHLWEELGLTQQLINRFNKTKISVYGELYTRVMVFNRLCDPHSKLGLFRWLEDVHIEDWQLPKDLGESRRFVEVQKFYHTLDYLEEWKEDIEKELYTRLKDLFNLKVDLVFYDTTSTYFEGETVKMAKRGKSKDGRPRNKQIVIGLVLCDGLPIAHHVFEGNRIDKTTVKETVKDLSSRFEIKRCIFVGDRGMVTKEIIEYLESEEVNYEYIVALRRRRCIETAKALEYNFGQKEEEISNVYVKEIVGAADELAQKEWGLAAKKGRKLLVCLSVQRKQEEEAKREEKMKVVEKELADLKASVQKGNKVDVKQIIESATRILMHHDGKRYFKYEVAGDGKFEYNQDEKGLKYEKNLDGKFVLLIRSDKLDAKDAVSAYKSLTEVEWAFRDLKSFEVIRPIWHRKDQRVKGHVFVCVLALLLDRVLQRKLYAANMNITSQMALESLRTFKAVATKVADKEFVLTTPVSAKNKEIFKAVGVKAPPRILAGN